MEKGGGGCDLAHNFRLAAAGSAPPRPREGKISSLDDVATYATYVSKQGPRAPRAADTRSTGRGPMCWSRSTKAGYQVSVAPGSVF